LAFLDLSWIEQLHPVKEWPEQIRKNRLTFSHEVLIEPPPLIFSREDFQVFSALQATPNFVGSKPASAQGFLLGGDVRPESLKGKIVIIESADPGYEWIFGSEIKGLVTKFGGGNSHMAVRCSELGIPAAIGVGSELFRRASNAVRVILDPLNRKIEFEQT
jgi:phosphohistidine swiveling domain-containing protein